MSEQKPIVTLKTTRFLPERDNEGKAIDEVIAVKIEHDSVEWHNYLKNIRGMGFVKPSGRIEVIKATILNNGLRVNVSESVLEKIKTEVVKATNDPEKELTPEQIRIANLEAENKAMAEKIDLLIKNSEAVDEKKPNEPNPELVEARKKYMDIAGKKGNPKWDVETINAKIKELEDAK